MRGCEERESRGERKRKSEGERKEEDDDVALFYYVYNIDYMESEVDDDVAGSSLSNPAWQPSHRPRRIL